MSDSMSRKGRPATARASFLARYAWIYVCVYTCTLGRESSRNFDPVCGASKLELYRRQNKTPLLFFYCYTTATTATAEHTK